MQTPVCMPVPSRHADWRLHSGELSFAAAVAPPGTGGKEPGRDGSSPPFIEHPPTAGPHPVRWIVLPGSINFPRGWRKAGGGVVS
jgi:hypothetical protein